MNTLPSAQIWMHKQVADPGFLVSEDPEVKRLLSDPDGWGQSILLDCCRWDVTKNYLIDFMNRYDYQLKKRRSMQATVESFLDLGKEVLFYIGGKHAENKEHWEELRVAGAFVQQVQNCLSLVKDYRASPLFKLVIDGADPQLMFAAQDLGYFVMAEDFPWPGHPCREFPTLAKDANAEKWAITDGQYDLIVSLGPHHIHSTDDAVMARNVQKWLDMGRVIHAGWVGTGNLPNWWPVNPVP